MSNAISDLFHCQSSSCQNLQLEMMKTSTHSEQSVNPEVASYHTNTFPPLMVPEGTVFVHILVTAFVHTRVPHEQSVHNEQYLYEIFPRVSRTHRTCSA